jgi:3-deoxy-D-manno-octulosonic-acid transferase
MTPIREPDKSPGLSRLIWFLYNLLFPLGFLLMLPHFLGRMRKRGGYQDRFGQRFGLYEPALGQALAQVRPLWIHAVSVGEMFVALEFIRAYRTRDPGARFVITTVTSTGRALALEKADPADWVLYYPLDFPGIVARALDLIRPRMLILTEGELWPNMLRQCAGSGIPVGIINGRMSEKSARGYRKLGLFTRRAMGLLDFIFAQSEGDRQRYLSVGADPGRVAVLGSVKYDMEADPAAAEKAQALFRLAGWGPATLVLLGGSTWPGEETALIDVFKRLRGVRPDLRLVLVPRHAERAGEVADELVREGIRGLRRSTLTGTEPVSPSPEALLVDTTGELKCFYAASHVVFVGKSMFENHGGQNIIEPAVYGKPILTGPNLENFPAIAEDFAQALAFAPVCDADALFRQADRLLGDGAAREDLGRRAAGLVAKRRGVMRATVDQIRRRLGDEA